MYRISVDRRRRLLELEIAGFWTIEEVGKFGAEAQQAAASLGPSPRGHYVLCDVSKAVIQSQDVVRAFQDFTAAAALQGRRLALHTDTPLARMQAKRIVTVRENAAVFGSRAAAEAWLFADEADEAGDAA